MYIFIMCYTVIYRYLLLSVDSANARSRALYRIIRQFAIKAYRIYDYAALRKQMAHLLLSITYNFFFIVQPKHSATELCALLGYYAASNGNPLQTFRSKVSFLFSRVKKSFFSWTS
jgi:hypothetical protein